MAPTTPSCFQVMGEKSRLLKGSLNGRKQKIIQEQVMNKMAQSWNRKARVMEMPRKLLMNLQIFRGIFYPGTHTTFIAY